MQPLGQVHEPAAFGIGRHRQRMKSATEARMPRCVQFLHPALRKAAADEQCVDVRQFGSCTGLKGTSSAPARSAPPGHPDSRSRRRRRGRCRCAPVGPSRGRIHGRAAVSPPAPATAPGPQSPRRLHVDVVGDDGANALDGGLGRPRPRCSGSTPGGAPRYRVPAAAARLPSTGRSV
jgi:hypothetical protein